MREPSADIVYQPRGQYENDVTCIWAVTCPAHSDIVSFSFTALDTEQSYDLVTLADGNALAAGSATQIAQLSGALNDLDRRSYQSDGPSMSIEFTTDSSVTMGGFAGTYTCGPPENAGPTCTDTLEQVTMRRLRHEMSSYTMATITRVVHNGPNHPGFRLMALITNRIAVNGPNHLRLLGLITPSCG